jgi:hypothetical protein
MTKTTGIAKARKVANARASAAKAKINREDAAASLNSQRLLDNAKAEMAKPATVIEPALARGAEGKSSVHSRKSLDDQRTARRPRSEPEVTTAKVVKAAKASKKAAKRPAKGSRLSHKQNKEVRALLTSAATAAGATRLTPIGFASYTEFLSGVPLDADGHAEVVFIPVKGNSPITGKNVKLSIKGGKVVKVK